MKNDNLNDILVMDIVPLSEYGKYFAYPTVGAMRQMLFHNTYGFADKVIRKIANRYYIKISALREWIEESNGGRVA